ncbi:MAG: hypothetical protein WBG76_01760, partial [Ornithinimicrobium sp.]
AGDSGCTGGFVACAATAGSGAGAGSVAGEACSGTDAAGLAGAAGGHAGTGPGSGDAVVTLASDFGRGDVLGVGAGDGAALRPLLAAAFGAL